MAKIAVLGDNPANDWEEEWRALREIGDFRAGTTFLFSFRFGESALRTNRSIRKTKQLDSAGRRDLRSLGICWIFYGAWRLLQAIVLVFCAGTATVMFGALLARVADPYSLMMGFHLAYIGLVIYSVVCGILGIATGLALMGRGNNARSIAVLAALFSLPELPLGVILGSYTLYCFGQFVTRQTQTERS